MSFYQLAIWVTSVLFAQCVIIHTPNGDIFGTTSGNVVDTYLGIRYGEISTRWSLARLPQPWAGIINATQFGSICHQSGPFKLPVPTPESEDCLFLNIWVPKNGSQPLPVRVWLHGGGYTAGSSNDYDSGNLAVFSQSIIITLNYRLGVFGFFPLPNVRPRNLGWIDQQLALQWIQENIPSFGGDKTNIMLFGQSAGGGSSIAHLLMESSWSLYSSVVLQSSGPFRLANCVESEEINWRILNTTFPECQSNLSCFQQLNGSRFYEELKINWATLWPCIGETSQLSDQPLTLIRKGLFNKKANVLGGFNSNEGESATFIFNSNDMSVSSARYQQLAEEFQVPQELVKRYDPSATDRNYFKAFSWLIGDYLSHCANIYLFNHLTKLSPASLYAYFFIHPTENWAFSPLNFNATHITEIPYVFHNQFALAALTPPEATLSLQMIKYFTLFHLSEQPWPSYKSNQTVFIFDVGNNTRNTRRGFEQSFLDRCQFVLKYLDDGDCQAYLTEQDCLQLDTCQWVDSHCGVKPTASASQHRFPSFLFVFVFLFLL
ncbi:unnamed protein product [Adineta ricciae]|uniref:Carboxylic ester hydrolase n=1 Tax=Adineta ricciae TaxID=249248 RepID=A0A815CAI9_ADIRI|nr:unnamed protein product [Adineta ricciae]CAF1284628.1 unnamed protein product [Adineta ricciae]